MNCALISIMVLVNSIALTITTGGSNYSQVLSNLASKRMNLAKSSEGGHGAVHHSSDALFTTLKDSIFPAWYGTTWDFNGTSNIPGEGEIACGYFVSTTLKHAGFNLNRFKLAQQAASVIVAAVCGKSNQTTFTSVNKVFGHICKTGDGLYIVGLDYHVGFILVEHGDVFFVHSDYFNGEVVREDAEFSAAFNSSGIYVLGEITHNDKLMRNWMSNTKLY